MVILGVLFNISVSAYSGFRDRAARIATRSNIRTLKSVVEAYRVDHSTYGGMTLTILRNDYDLEIDDTAATTYALSNLTPTSYCIQNRNSDWYAWSEGPSDQIHTGTASHC